MTHIAQLSVAVTLLSIIGTEMLHSSSMRFRMAPIQISRTSRVALCRRLKTICSEHGAVAGVVGI